MNDVRKPTDAPCAGLPGSAGLFFRQLLSAPDFGEFALILKRLTGLSMALNTPDVATVRAGIPTDSGNPLCRIIRDTANGARRCEACDRRQQSRAAAEGRARLYACHAGFYDMAIPILVQGEHVATISSGQVLPERPSPTAFERFRRRLHWLNIPERRLRQAYNEAPWMPRERLRYVMRLLALFAQQMCNSAWRIRELEAGLERPAIRRARSLVEERFRDPQLRLCDAAACAGISVAHFSHVFHRETGVTFTRYVQSRRVEDAKRLLAESSQTVTEICFSCGFNSLTHFNRVFRRGEGCSPSHWRTARQWNPTGGR
jgi:AraC-like DNA-binding protein